MTGITLSRHCRFVDAPSDAVDAGRVNRTQLRQFYRIGRFRQTMERVKITTERSKDFGWWRLRSSF